MANLSCLIFKMEPTAGAVELAKHPGGSALVRDLIFMDEEDCMVAPQRRNVKKFLADFAGALAFWDRSARR
jgi:hypothetical protein